VTVKDMGNRVVARFRDGKTFKGTVASFSPLRDRFTIMTPQQRVLEVRLRDLKAVFFVRTFSGRPQYNERKTFDNASQPGHKLACEFHDGEVLVGTSPDPNAAPHGFFLVPADPTSNNERVFVVNTSTRRVTPFE
jgi:hypothetical protein